MLEDSINPLVGLVGFKPSSHIKFCTMHIVNLGIGQAVLSSYSLVFDAEPHLTHKVPKVFIYLFRYTLFCFNMFLESRV